VPAYFFVLAGSTLAALLLLALAGAWTLWAFRDRERPYLWLAAPLAGIATLSLSLSLLYVVCRLTVPVSFLVAMLLNGAATLAVCRRSAGDLVPRRRRELVVGLAALLGVTAAGVWLVLGTAVRQGEPTILIGAGTDQFGYSHMGDWMLRHPHEMPVASSARPYESYVELLINNDTRHGAFLLAAVTAWCRGTTTLFSLDFATGVAWCAALLGFAAAFARRPLLFLTLIVAAALSIWLRNARCGFFGKTLAYPGCLLLVPVFLQTWRDSTPLRLVSFLVLGAGFGLCHTPAVLAATVGLVFLGVVFARGSEWAAARLFRRPPSAQEAETGPLWKGGLLGAMVVLPLALVFFSHAIYVSRGGHTAFSATTDWVAAEALDVALPEAKSRSLQVLLAGAALGCALTCIAGALAARTQTAGGLLLSSGASLAGWCTGWLWFVYQTQGLLYPLTLGGVALLIQHPSVRRLRWLRLASPGLLLGLAAAHVPQFVSTMQRCTDCASGAPPFIAQSQVAAAIQRIGSNTVDVCHDDIRICLSILTELEGRGIPIQYREPSWTAVLGYRQWDLPRYAAYGQFLINPWVAWLPCEKSAAQEPLPVARNEGLWIAALKPPYGLGRDKVHGSHFWLGGCPAEAVLVNATTEPLAAQFLASVEFVPFLLDGGCRTLVWELDGRRGRVEVCAPARPRVCLPLPLGVPLVLALGLPQRAVEQIHIPLELPPGDHAFRLWVQQAASSDSSPRKGRRELLLLISRFSLQRCDPGEHREQGPSEPRTPNSGGTTNALSRLAPKRVTSYEPADSADDVGAAGRRGCRCSHISWSFGAAHWRPCCCSRRLVPGPCGLSAIVIARISGWLLRWRALPRCRCHCRCCMRSAV
jgi:hypothetical protein